MEEIFTETPIVEIVTPKKTKGERFKEKHGISLTLHKLIVKSGAAGIEAYKLLRRARKKSQKELSRKKHSAALSGRGSKSTDKVKKKK